MSTFRALLVSKAENGQSVDWKDLDSKDLMPGDVTVDVTHTTINYKDGLAVTGKGPVVRKWPMIPGIDFAGRVSHSGSPEWKPGDDVILNGWGVGETHWGGYASKARVSAGWLVRRPPQLSAAQTMAIGTAGYTAMLCVIALEAHGVAPSSGPILVTGAAGGVGSVAIAILSKLGYHVTASTGRPEETSYLQGLGVKDIIPRAELAGSPRPLAKERWAGAIDVAGGTTLANVISQIRYGGTVAACGLAQSMDLPTSVAPFILRGVTLAGIDSVMAPKAKRVAAWDRLARDLDPTLLEHLTVHRPLTDVIALAPEILAGKIRGRVVLTV